MKLYHYKPLKVGFVVLCPDPSVGALRTTVNSIRSRYASPCVASVPQDTPAEIVAEMRKVCPVFEGQGTVTSLINVGLDHAPSEWNLTVMGGTWVRHNLDKKYSYFVERESDVLYAIVDGRYEFPDCSLNGIMIHKDTWDKVGHFCPKNPLPVCKLMWAQEAIGKGSQFKAIIGARIV